MVSRFAPTAFYFTASGPTGPENLGFFVDNKTWVFNAMVQASSLSSGPSGGINVGVMGPSGSTLRLSTWGSVTGSTSSQTSVLSGSGGATGSFPRSTALFQKASGAIGPMEFMGSCVSYTAGVSGYLQLVFGAGVSGQTGSLQPGAYLTAWQAS